jgi:hypothetical protein
VDLVLSVYVTLDENGNPEGFAQMSSAQLRQNTLQKFTRSGTNFTCF